RRLVNRWSDFSRGPRPMADRDAISQVTDNVGPQARRSFGQLGGYSAVQLLGFRLELPVGGTGGLVDPGIHVGLAQNALGYLPPEPVPDLVLQARLHDGNRRNDLARVVRGDLSTEPGNELRARHRVQLTAIALKPLSPLFLDIVGHPDPLAVLSVHRF